MCFKDYCCCFRDILRVGTIIFFGIGNQMADSMEIASLSVINTSSAIGLVFQ